MKFLNKMLKFLVGMLAVQSFGRINAQPACKNGENTVRGGDNYNTKNGVGCILSNVNDVKDPFSVFMLELSEDEKMVTLPAKCVVSSPKPGKLGIQLSVSTNYQGSSESIANFCNLDEDQGCKRSITNERKIIFDKPVVYGIKAHNNTLSRVISRFFIANLACSFRDKECEEKVEIKCSAL